MPKLKHKLSLGEERKETLVKGDLNKLCKEKFDRNIAYKAYKKWLKTHRKDDFTYALYKTLPAIGFTIRLFFSDESKRCEDDELIAESSMLVYERLRRKMFLGQNAMTYQAYFVTSIKGTMLKAIRNSARGVFECRWWDTLPPIGRVANERDVEAKLFLSELPKAMIEHICKENRFKSDKESRAIKHVAKRLVGGRRVVPKLITEYYGIEDPTYLIDYTLIKLRQYLYNSRLDLDDLYNGHEYYDIGYYNYEEGLEAETSMMDELWN
jgi:hypothetical protein